MANGCVCCEHVRAVHTWACLCLRRIWYWHAVEEGQEEGRTLPLVELLSLLLDVSALPGCRCGHHTCCTVQAPSYAHASSAALLQAAMAMEGTHAAGMTHGDLKPCKTLLHEEGGVQRLSLCDFGGADVRRSDGTPCQAR